VGRPLRDVLALEDDLPVRDLEVRVPHDHVREGRLAGPVRTHQRMDLALADDQVEAAEDLLLPRPDAKVLNLQLGRHATTRSPLLENSTGSARVVVCSERMIPPWTRVHSSFVAQPRPASGSCEHSTRSVWSCTKHSIGAIVPSRACTTSSIEISSAGRASQ